MMDKHVFPASEMKKAALDLYELPMDTDLYEAFGHILKSLPFWKPGMKYLKQYLKKEPELINSLIRFYNYFYSQNLTCIEAIHKDEKERKVVCALMAGFKPGEDGSFDKKTDAILGGRIEECNMMLFDFLKIQGSHRWATIKWLTDLYYKNMAKQTAVDGLEFQRIIKGLDEIEDQKLKLLRGDTSPQLNISMIQRMQAEEIGLSPEHIASNIEQSKSPIGINI